MTVTVETQCDSFARTKRKLFKDVLKTEVKNQAFIIYEITKAPYNTHLTKQDNENPMWFTAFSSVLLKHIPLIHLLFEVLDLSVSGWYSLSCKARCHAR